MSRRQRRQRGAGLVGTGGGIGISVLAQSLPAGWAFLTPWLLYLAPAAAVALSALWAYGVAALRARIARRALAGNLAVARRLNREIQTDTTATGAHKLWSQRRLEALERMVMEVETASAEDLLATLDEPAPPEAMP